MLSMFRRLSDASATALMCSGRLLRPFHPEPPSGLRLKAELGTDHDLFADRGKRFASKHSHWRMGHTFRPRHEGDATIYGGLSERDHLLPRPSEVHRKRKNSYPCSQGRGRRLRGCCFLICASALFRRVSCSSENKDDRGRSGIQILSRDALVYFLLKRRRCMFRRGSALLLLERGRRGRWPGEYGCEIENRGVTEMRAKLVRSIGSHTHMDGVEATDIPGVELYRRSAPTACMSGQYEPKLIVFAQGKKRINVGKAIYVCGNQTFC